MRDVKAIKILIVEIIIGVIILGIGLSKNMIVNHDYYSNLLISMGIGLTAASVAQIIRILYWNSPKHKQEYEIRKRNAHINSVDERQQQLRAKAGYTVCQMTFILLFVMGVVLSFLHVDAWVIGLIIFILLFMFITWTVAFRRLEKRM